jgi:2'-hydroxyisoflavone reductase
MNILVLGGTRFIGRHIVEELLASGHDVSVFTRGKSPDDLPGDVERLHGDRDDGIGGLAGLGRGKWTACVDVSGYTPHQVRPSAEVLRDRVDRYLFISTVSVYEDSNDVPVLETHPLMKPAAEDVTDVTADTYGPLKVTCERIVEEHYGDRSTILRPQIVAGPHDPTGRHTYWVQRAGQPGEMLAPGDGSDHVQVVDARDVARFTRHAIEAGISGVFNMAGPRITWAEFVRMLGARDIAWVPARVVDAAGLTFAELPLYRPEGSERSSLMDVSHDRADAAGLTLTPPEATVRDTREWLRGNPVPPHLSPEREREVIQLSRRTPSS